MSTYHQINFSAACIGGTIRVRQAELSQIILWQPVGPRTLEPERFSGKFIPGRGKLSIDIL